MIDVHAHFLPAFYREALSDNGHGEPDGFPHIPEWSAVEHLGAMDRLGIATSMLSISSPGVALGGESAIVELTRAVNDEGRRCVVDHPGRFGLLASLPLPDIDAAITEIDRCMSRLQVDGFTMLTNIGGTYISDPSFAPVFAELDRRSARVLLHPTSPPCWEHTSLGRPRPMLEFLFDTTRTVVELILSGTVAKHPGIEFIVPHAGATLPMIADRVSMFALLLEVDPSADVMADLARLHYDLAGYPIPRQLDSLLTITSLNHLHYGSDYPFTPEFAAAAGRRRLDEAGDPTGSITKALRANTEQLFPQLGTRGR